LTRLQKALIRLDTDLRAGGFRYALVGGFAVTLRAEPRTTRDLDVVLVVSGDREAESVVLVLRMRGYKDHPKGAAIERPDGRLATIRLISPPVEDDGTGVQIDLLVACAGIEPEVVAASQRLEVMPRVYIPVARSGHLVAMKVLAARPQDLEDVRMLLREIGDADLQLARESLVLIERRGFLEDSTRSLLAELERLLDQVV
jgi:Nucleotidyl transferase AbiEii toxin, Type IV TA system